MDDIDLASCPNVPALVAAACATRRATLHELDTIYSVEDAYDILEMARVEAHNQRLLNEHAREKVKR